MVMIRRELPRTRRAGWALTPYRIEADEGSPCRGPRADLGPASPTLIADLHVSCRDGLVVRLGLDRNRPDETQQFAADGRHRLVLVFASGGELSVAAAEPQLRFPSDAFDLVT
jgi:hypothetical protein